MSKSFRIPSVRRDTVREHALDLFRRRPHERLRVLDDVSFELRRGESLGLMGTKRLRQEHAPEDRLRHLPGATPARCHVRAPVTPILELGSAGIPISTRSTTSSCSAR